ncbi:MAG TPA: PHP domain-containing protein [Myxococcota bacterium]|nr:PHP domain-containing protein [Myxococcota bacterium]HRY94877.1 PHP domain-containing protein [Myxococcota bacterium]HSA20924.1 PHP domain-containing protein [Myxococcota bacterium]
MERIDLHAHTTASDGSLRPAELVQLAARLGLRAVALTDHDGLDGLAEGLAEGRRLGLEVVPGIELSTRRDGLGSLHLLGLWLEPTDAGLRAWLAGQQATRVERNQRLLARLAELGMPLDPQQVARQAGGPVIGRPHVAQALVAGGHAATVADAFARWLSRGRPAYVERVRPSPEEAIEVLHRAGGLTILAHPGLAWRGERARQLGELAALARAGLDGIELRHPELAPDWAADLAAEAARLGLLPSGGSDFHGAAKPEIRLGEPPVPAEWLEGLRARRIARLPDHRRPC